LRGVHKGRALQARVIVVIVPELKKLKPWYLLTTDLELDVIAAVEAYAGRAQVEVNFDEAKNSGWAITRAVQVQASDAGPS
jgi:hypothetical protein